MKGQDSRPESIRRFDSAPPLSLLSRISESENDARSFARRKPGISVRLQQPLPVATYATSEVARSKSRITREKALVTQAIRLRLAATQSLLRRCSRRFVGRTPDQIVSYDCSATKWWRRFGRKERSQNRQCLRHKRNENDYEHCCTLHARRS